VKPHTVTVSRYRGVQMHLGDAKCVTKILVGDKNKGLGVGQIKMMFMFKIL